MGHKFDAKNKHKLDNERRRKMLPPSETLKKLGLSEKDIMADIGCGIGYFTLPASEIVGEGGKVLAIDVSSEMLQDVEVKFEEQHISNIECVKIDGTSFNIDDEAVTYGFMCNVLHEIDHKEQFLNEIKRIIKEKGKLVIIEWAKIESDYGPPMDHRLDKKVVENLFKENNFKNISVIELNENYYAVTGEK